MELQPKHMVSSASSGSSGSSGSNADASGVGSDDTGEGGDGASEGEWNEDGRKYIEKWFNFLRYALLMCVYCMV